MDILLIGNDYGMELLNGHSDALNGLVLKNIGVGHFSPISLQKSGFFVPNDAKAISRINLGKKEYILATQNRDSVKVFAPMVPFLKSIPLKNNEVKALIVYKNNQKQLREFYWGSSFGSQEPRNFNWTANIKSVTFYNQKGQVIRRL